MLSVLFFSVNLFNKMRAYLFSFTSIVLMSNISLGKEPIKSGVYRSLTHMYVIFVRNCFCAVRHHLIFLIT
ncbi:hypothetical protein BD560DRAFT_394798 [Blakeslea trispora]|nr:hypothetical protein BD560DRAFT_394798 [Blakeslea trispora]